MPVTRPRSITRYRSDPESTRSRIRSSSPLAVPKNTNPFTRRIWTCRPTSERDPVGGRTVDVAPVRGAELDVVHQRDPAVVHREEDERHDQAEHHPGQEPAEGDRQEDQEQHHVLGQRQGSADVEEPFDEEPQADETSTPPTIIRGITSISDAPNTAIASGTAAATNPAVRASTPI